MNFFRKPIIAVICAVIIVLSSTCLSVKTNFEQKCLEVIDGFYDGELYGGTVETPIASYLADIANSAFEIVYMADEYGVDTEELVWCIDDLQYAMTDYYDEISYVYYCYEQILENIKIVNNELYAMPLTALEQQDLSAFNWRISQAASSIKASAYNDSVRLFNRANMHFPTDFLCELADVDLPERFG